MSGVKREIVAVAAAALGLAGCSRGRSAPDPESAPPAPALEASEPQRYVQPARADEAHEAEDVPTGAGPGAPDQADPGFGSCGASCGASCGGEPDDQDDQDDQDEE